MTTANMVSNLLPCFVAALAAQRLTEFVDLFVRQAKPSDAWPSKKTWYLAVIAIAVGVVCATVGRPFLVLDALRVDVHGQVWIDVVISALVISGGTETINEILKFLGYKKEETKAKAAQTHSQAAKTYAMKS